MRTALLRCYPARWRARYGDEFATILAERPLGPFDVADILLGALDAHLHLRGLGTASEHGRGFAMSLRIGGFAAVCFVRAFGIAFLGEARTDAAREAHESSALLRAPMAILAAITEPSPPRSE